MAEKIKGPFKELPYKKVLNDLTFMSEAYADDNREIRKFKTNLESTYGAVQMQVFYDSLPKKATPYLKKGENPATALFYALPISAKEFITTGAKEKTKGFKHGGLAGQGHNDMRKGGLFK